MDRGDARLVMKLVRGKFNGFLRLSSRLSQKRRRVRFEDLLNGQQEGSESKGTNTADEFVFLKSQLQTTSEKYDLLRADLQQAKQLEAVRSGPHSILEDNDRRVVSSIMKHGMLRESVRRSILSDHGEAHGRLQEQEKELHDLKRQLAGKEKVIQQQKLQFDDAIKALANSQIRSTQSVKTAPQPPMSPAVGRRGPVREEMHILREAIATLRASFKESDPNHHTLDTLEQCVAVVLDRLASAESCQQMEAPESSPSKRAPITSLHGQHSFTKVVYYTEKTVTPFLSSVPKQLGEITLRDFKLIFDRPGSYRFHFKSMDPEFGMVKEEISNDDEILPGFDGKIISWVVEDHGN